MNCIVCFPEKENWRASGLCNYLETLSIHNNCHIFIPLLSIWLTVYLIWVPIRGWSWLFSIDPSLHCGFKIAQVKLFTEFVTVSQVLTKFDFSCRWFVALVRPESPAITLLGTWNWKILQCHSNGAKLVIYVCIWSRWLTSRSFFHFILMFTFRFCTD